MAKGGASKTHEQNLSSAVKGYLQTAKLRDKAARSVPVIAPKAKFFHNATEHRAVMMSVFVELLLSKHSQEELAKEFFETYRHLFDGGSIQELPVKILNHKALQARIKEVLRGGHLLDETTEDSNK